MSNITTVLNASPVFKMLGKEDIERLGPFFDERQVVPGDMLATAKEPAQYFFLLAQGTLLLSMDEGRALVMDKPGDFVGMELLSAWGICRNSVTVLEKGRVFVVPRNDFLSLIQEDSPAAEAIMASWQAYLETTASFVKDLEDKRLPEHF